MIGYRDPRDICAIATGRVIAARARTEEEEAAAT